MTQWLVLSKMVEGSLLGNSISSTHKRDSYVNSPVTAKQWDAYAARALILLSPLGENKGIWPLPTARTLKQCEDMLARYHVGMKEVSSTLRYLSIADKTIPCYRRICR